jgi:hypothetical protein
MGLDAEFVVSYLAHFRIRGGLAQSVGTRVFLSIWMTRMKTSELPAGAPTLPTAASTARLALEKAIAEPTKSPETIEVRLATHLFQYTARSCPPLRLGAVAHELKIVHLWQVSPWQNGESR